MENRSTMDDQPVVDDDLYPATLGDEIGADAFARPALSHQREGSDPPQLQPERAQALARGHNRFRRPKNGRCPENSGTFIMEATRIDVHCPACRPTYSTCCRTRADTPTPRATEVQRSPA